MRVLIVDDAAFMRMVLSKIVEDAGYEVIGEAANGEQAIMEYKRRRPDVVTMDLTMPIMDGITATRMIREFDPAARVLVTSAMGQAVMVKDAIHSGAYDFVVKPVDQNRLLAALANARSK
jgi:two-component system, chemotaxis family, chemotaxis protein CheY